MPDTTVVDMMPTIYLKKGDAVFHCDELILKYRFNATCILFQEDVIKVNYIYI